MGLRLQPCEGQDLENLSKRLCKLIQRRVLRKRITIPMIAVTVMTTSTLEVS